jgi:predicted TPR repeat methyltransferase
VDEDRDEASHALHIGDLSMQLNDAVSAVAWYQKSASLGTGDASFLVRLAEAQARAGHLDQARATVDRALEQDPQHAAARGLSVRLQAR